MASSGTNTTRSTHARAAANAILPTRRGAERVGRHPAHLDVDRLTCDERRMQGRTTFRLHPHDTDVSLEPRGDPRDQPAAPHRDQDRIGVRHLLGKLQPDGPPTGHDLGLIERVHRQRAGFGLARERGHRRLVVVAGDHSNVGAHLADPIDLGGRRGIRHEDLGAVTERPGRVCDRQPEVAAGGRDHARDGDVGREHLVERTARLERPRVL